MTALLGHLLRRISAQGPMPLSEYMATCLMHPEHGYYATRDPLGAAGDFTTAPEISQMFGELIGLSLAQSWLDQGAPDPFCLTEPGPGRGTLMADILRATRGVPGFHEAAQIHLVETSPTLRKAQGETLKTAPATRPVIWHDSVDDLPDMPLFLIANEFFDALPIRQVRRTGDMWRECCVGAEGDRLCFGLSEPAPLPQLAHRLVDTREGDLVEFCPAATAIATSVGSRIRARGGVALIIDYGDWRALGDTLQAVQNHQPADPLINPGQADLTAHVDFEALTLATPCTFTRLTPQGVFLERLGITDRARALAENLTGAALENHIAAHRRLTHPQEMGTLFKVIAFYPDGGTPPPGLDP